MFAHIVEFVPIMEKKEEFVHIMKDEVLPILKKQNGFLEFLPLFPEMKDEKMIAMTLWTDKTHLERYEHNWFPKVHEIMKPHLKGPMTSKVHKVETTLCEHFVQALAA